jgi:hypothetical protein
MSSCIRCGCQGEFQNPDTGTFYVLTNSVGLNKDIGFLTSERCCFCATCPKDHGKGCESLASRDKRSKGVPSSMSGELAELKEHQITMSLGRAMWEAHAKEINTLYETIKELFPVAEECKRLLQENGPTTPHMCTLPNSKTICLDGTCYADEACKISITALEILEPELEICDAFCAFTERVFNENACTGRAKIVDAIAGSQGKSFEDTLLFWMSQ